MMLQMEIRKFQMILWFGVSSGTDDDDKTKGDVAQLVKVPSLKSTVQCNVPG
jgi:hypothetical protein